MQTSKHEMPFGAVVQDGGAVRFSLWAPDVRSVDLLLDAGRGERAFAMVPQPEGGFELTIAAAPGERYRFRLPDGLCVPDPASRWNPGDVHGQSAVIDPAAFDWGTDTWPGRPWHEAVLYELHVGTFTPEGSFRAAAAQLEPLQNLGITALNLMPVADFPGSRNWGYDGVLPFAPDARYGTPDDLKHLICEAHRLGLMVLLDVVYNHFGPEGNYLHVYAQPFFSRTHQTPWGAAINFDGAGSRTVREFFIHNALYWLEEYRLDGLRLDAVHALADDTRPDILEELAERVRTGPGRDRPIHLVLENDANAARYLTRAPDGRPRAYAAQWNDDLHHALHVLLTGETGGYYRDYAEVPLRHLGRALAEGFAYQGEPSPYRHGRPRGEPSRGLPPTAFVAFLQNHDQIGNRAFGERLASLVEPRRLRAAIALLLLAPSPPLLFMGEEFGSVAPFQYFCDFEPGLRERVAEGRRQEFARFPEFADLARGLPDPGEDRTFLDSKLDWDRRETPEGAEWLEFYRRLLAVRRTEIVPRLPGIVPGASRWSLPADTVVRVDWPLEGGGGLCLIAQLGDAPVAGLALPPGRLLASSLPPDQPPPPGALAAWSTGLWLVEDGNPERP